MQGQPLELHENYKTVAENRDFKSELISVSKAYFKKSYKIIII